MNEEHFLDGLNFIRETLDEASPDADVYPEDVERRIPVDLDLYPIDSIEFDEDQGFYEIVLDGGAHIRMCVVCGEAQPMNAEAYWAFGLTDVFLDVWHDLQDTPAGELAGRLNFHENAFGDWNNSPCERRHSPYTPGWA